MAEPCSGEKASHNTLIKTIVFLQKFSLIKPTNWDLPHCITFHWHVLEKEMYGTITRVATFCVLIDNATTIKMEEGQLTSGVDLTNM